MAVPFLASRIPNLLTATQLTSQLCFNYRLIEPSVISEPARSVSAAICDLKQTCNQDGGGSRARGHLCVPRTTQRRSGSATLCVPLLTSRISNFLTMLELIFQRFNYRLIESRRPSATGLTPVAFDRVLRFANNDT